jgi:3-methyladenine DNA glycosylase AlkC
VADDFTRRYMEYISVRALVLDKLRKEVEKLKNSRSKKSTDQGNVHSSRLKEFEQKQRTGEEWSLKMHSTRQVKSLVMMTLTNVKPNAFKRAGPPLQNNANNAKALKPSLHRPNSG